MINAKFDPTDVRKLNIALHDLGPEKLLRGKLLPLVKEIGEVAGKYPPDFPGNTYVRTGHLGSSWRHGLINPLTAEVGNAADYAGWVQGTDQTALHRGHGWLNLFKVGDKLVEEFLNKIAAKVDRIWRR